MPSQELFKKIDANFFLKEFYPNVSMKKISNNISNF